MNKKKVIYNIITVVLIVLALGSVSYAVYFKTKDYKGEEGKYQKAEEYFDDEKYDKALKIYNDILGYKQSEDRVISIYNHWAEENEKKGNYKEAKDYYSKAVVLCENSYSRNDYVFYLRLTKAKVRLMDSKMKMSDFYKKNRNAKQDIHIDLSDEYAAVGITASGPDDNEAIEKAKEIMTELDIDSQKVVDKINALKKTNKGSESARVDVGDDMVVDVDYAKLRGVRISIRDDSVSNYYDTLE